MLNVEFGNHFNLQLTIEQLNSLTIEQLNYGKLHFIQPGKAAFRQGSGERSGKSCVELWKDGCCWYTVAARSKRTAFTTRLWRSFVAAGAEVFEYQGIRPNPVIEDVDAAAALGRRNQVDVVLAVGGGSVIDSAKIISITIPVSHSGWDFMKGKAKPETAVPLISVLTLAATGTEMNRFAVVQNNARPKKNWAMAIR